MEEVGRRSELYKGEAPAAVKGVGFEDQQQTTSISSSKGFKMHFSTILSALFTASVSFASPTPTEKRQTSCSPAGISAESSARVVSAFKSSGVVAELIPSIQPKVAVNVAYGSKQVDLGNKFKTTGSSL